MNSATQTFSQSSAEPALWYNQPAQTTADGIGYWQVGDKGTPVLLVMGFGMSGLAWEPQVDALCRHHRVALFDHVGMCTSRDLHPKESRSMKDLAHHALSVMDHLGWDKAHIAGVSLGGMITQQMALLAPERFLSMTLIATTPGGLFSPMPTMQGLRGFLKANAAKTAEERLKAIRTLLFPPEYLALSEPSQGRSNIPWSPAPAKTRLAHLRAVIKFNSRRKLKKLESLPTMIVRPGKDILVPPSESDMLKKLLPHAEVLDLPMGGHGVMWQHREEINQGLLRHFKQVDKEVTEA
jgi:pimeloyl-ACP methyl ester carboxylesterase